jgi:hypothetical protein
VEEEGDGLPAHSSEGTDPLGRTTATGAAPRPLLLGVRLPPPLHPPIAPCRQVSFLMQKGAEWRGDKDQVTPFHYAARSNRQDVLRYLVRWVGSPLLA